MQRFSLNSIILMLVLTIAFFFAPIRSTIAADEPRSDDLPATVQFNRDIRPILSDTCYNCHGPDENQRQAGLRLDTESGAKVDLGGYRAIVGEDVAASRLIAKITAADPAERMPPPEADRTLSPRQIALLKRWIEQGAKWELHWSLEPPTRPAAPVAKDSTWTRNAIDAFVLARLQLEEMHPSPEADRETLIRRVTLDLTGLPPTPAEVDAFLADPVPGAYERLVERLLASPRYGERMAVTWLDASRYADTSGYQTDGVRHMWRWRDWVIDAFNANMPFDQFTIEQLAGDLLPAPTLDELVATGFNRNHRANSEGGIVPEEYLVEYAVDRLDTTATVWLGLTLGCARCHDHKYDPITQKEFYGLLAFFNNVPERGRVIKYGNSFPYVKSPTPEMQRQLEALTTEAAAAHRAFDELEPRIEAAQRNWEQALVTSRPTEWTIEDDLAARFKFDGDVVNVVVPAENQKPTDAAGSTESTSKQKDGTSHQSGFRSGDAKFASGVIGQAAHLDGKCYIAAGDVPPFAGDDKVSLSLWFHADAVHDAPLLSLMDDDDSRDKGFALRLDGGRIAVNYGPRWLDDALKLQTKSAVQPGRWHHVMVTYDGSQMAAGLKLFLDGEAAETDVLLDFFTGTFTTPPLLRVGSEGEEEGFRGRIDDVRYYRRELSAEEVRIVATTAAVDDIARLTGEKRTRGEASKIRRYFLAQEAPDHLRAAFRRKVEAGERCRAFEETIPTTMIMQEAPAPRPTHVLIRGEYDKPGEEVSAGVPASLPPLPEDAPRNRLGLARWLVDPANPLTARVAANRLWQLHFGAGLVATPEDFGSQGAWPTHPELLDWLATEFIESGWNVKHLQRLIVTSATYRQSSHVSAEQLARDPNNEWLGRAPRLRLPSETVRDQALAAAGLLRSRIGGPSVKPYQPEGLWAEIASDTHYEQDHGADLYRRSLYTFWKRTVPPPSMTTFDGTSREACTVRRSRTNTPLQALALLNDVTYVEAARKVAERMIREGGEESADRIAHGLRLVLARRPTHAEADILDAALDRHLARNRKNVEAARKLLALGESPYDAEIDATTLAAYTAVAGLIVNMDEAVTRE